MRQNFCHKKSRKAFSLIELSILITVISVIIAAMVSVSSSHIANEKNKAGNDNINIIYKALGKYLLANKKLPCPASLLDVRSSSSTYATALNTTDCVGSGVYQSVSSTNLIYGMVPTQTLGLNYDSAEDAFGNKIIYIVDKRLTTTTSDSFETNVGNSTLISVTGISSVSNALFVLMSRGANASGAYNANSSSAPAASSDSNELSNDASGISDNSYPTVATSTFDSTFVQSNSSTNFDDVVFYKTEEEMFNDFDAWWLIPCTSASSTETLYGTSITWPKAYANQIVTANNNCPSGWTGGLTTPTKKCGAKGVWGSVINVCTLTP